MCFGHFAVSFEVLIQHFDDFVGVFLSVVVEEEEVVVDDSADVEVVGLFFVGFVFEEVFAIDLVVDAPVEEVFEQLDGHDVVVI